MRVAACAAYARLCPDDLSAHVAPGMPALLERLAARDGHACSRSSTGNYEPIARLKLRRAGIGHFFATGQGGFGSDHEDRAMLPAIARRARAPATATASRGRGRAPRSSATRRATSPARAPTACASRRSRPGPSAPDELRGADAVARDADELGDGAGALAGRRELRCRHEQRGRGSGWWWRRSSCSSWRSSCCRPAATTTRTRRSTPTTDGRHAGHDARRRDDARRTTPAPPAADHEPAFETVRVAGGKPVGGDQDDHGRRRASARASRSPRPTRRDEIHLHGYDIARDLKAGGRVRFSFEADAEGIFEIELEGAGTQIGKLTVEP